jgi:hypothetical protein
MDKTEQSTPEISNTRFRVGVTILLAGQLSTLLIPLVSHSNLSDTWKTLLSTTLFFVTPQIGIVWAVAVFGKAGYARLKSIIGGWFKQYGPPEVVGRTRYTMGLFMFVLPVLLGWAGPYYGDSIPGYPAYEMLYATGGDLLFVLSFFVLGGEFWDKIRSLFVYRAKAQFPNP